MNSLRKSVITVVGGLLLFIGIIFAIFPGPAFLFIPVGLVILSFEYPIARNWLKRFQRYMSVAARKMDQWLLRRR